MSFAENLRYGVAGESTIARWFRQRGYAVLPAYEKLIDSGKGPRLYLPDGSLIAPDLLVFKGQKIYWIEAKHKTAFSWHRQTSRWVTGIDLKHYKAYQEVDRITDWPVWLFFLHEGGQAKDSPPNSPSGLFANELSFLVGHENHRHSNWGSSGMVYWAIDSLRKLGECEATTEVERHTTSQVESSERGTRYSHMQAA